MLIQRTRTRLELITGRSIGIGVAILEASHNTIPQLVVGCGSQNPHIAGIAIVVIVHELRVASAGINVLNTYIKR